jgi:hypothetical protein
MKHLIVSLTIGACLLVPSAGMTLAASGTTKAPTTHQPGVNGGVSCGSASGPSVPGGPTGGAATNTASPFAGGSAGGVYANTFSGNGATPSGQAQVSNNQSATSQYDIACAQVP